MRGNAILYVLIGVGAIGAVAFVLSSSRNTIDNVNEELSVSQKANNATGSLPEIIESRQILAQNVVDYSESKFAQVVEEGKTPVLYFRADWCPTCRAADAAFRANPQGIPDSVVLLRINYDTATELKRQYGITLQHTFVQVDENGTEITKWIGGDIKELNDNLVI